jgi:uncharacterized protein (TIGR02600 family)
VVRSLVDRDGDWRLTMAKKLVDASGAAEADMVVHPGYTDSGKKLVHSFMNAKYSHGQTGADMGGKLVPDANYSKAFVPKVPSNLTPDAGWDWDSSLPWARDGAYANKADEGNVYVNGGSNPYYNAENTDTAKMFSYFTANRIITSPVMFGSLPTGVIEGISWRTLLFRPAPSSVRTRDENGPKDYLMLDLFTMPVVEPYAISEPFSTAGKINMNYQIVPFNYIQRDTGVRAVLGSELIARVNKAYAKQTDNYNQAPLYKGQPGTNPPSIAGKAQNARLPVDLKETLKQFEDKFTSWDIFRSAAEICDIYLVPKGYTWPNFAADWYGEDFALVGDNVREKPYANVYPRLTTKSNSFTVHYTVQALKAPPTMPAGKWDDKIGVVVGEYRGSTSLERFLDPNNPNIPDYAKKPNSPGLDNYYQWRVVASDAFVP